MLAVLPVHHPPWRPLQAAGELSAESLKQQVEWRVPGWMRSTKAMLQNGSSILRRRVLQTRKTFCGNRVGRASARVHTRVKTPSRAQYIHLLVIF